MVYIFISEFNRITNCRWRIISSYDGGNILFNAAYIFVVGISSFYKGGLDIDYQLQMDQLDLGLSIYCTCLRNGRTRSITQYIANFRIRNDYFWCYFNRTRSNWFHRTYFIFIYATCDRDVFTFIMFTIKRCILKGMLGITATASQIDGFTAIIAFSIFLFVVILSNFGKGFVKSYAVLIGLISGWILFLIAGKVTIPSQVTHFVQLPQIFAWGLPKWNTGMAVSSFVMVCILVSNTVAAIIAINQATIQKRLLNRNS